MTVAPALREFWMSQGVDQRVVEEARHLGDRGGIDLAVDDGGKGHRGLLDKSGPAPPALPFSPFATDQAQRRWSRPRSRCGRSARRSDAACGYGVSSGRRFRMGGPERAVRCRTRSGYRTVAGRPDATRLEARYGRCS
jgi:hypothetical protein